jgi:hypothetical protein
MGRLEEEVCLEVIGKNGVAFFSLIPVYKGVYI